VRVIQEFRGGGSAVERAAADDAEGTAAKGSAAGQRHAVRCARRFQRHVVQRRIQQL
jgi:hypothetical protein